MYLLLMSYLVSLFVLQFSVFADDGPAQFVQAAGQLIQPLLHTQQQIPAQYHRETEVTDGAENFFGIHGLCQHGNGNDLDAGFDEFIQPQAAAGQHACFDDPGGCCLRFG